MLVIVATIATRSARADDPPEEAAVLAGAATALVPFGVASVLLTRQGGTREPRAAVLVLSSGLALAPVVAHLIVREWGRAAFFGGVGVSAAAGLVALFEVNPWTIGRGNARERWAAGTLLGVLLAGTTFGLIDCLLADERAAVAVVPSFGRGVASLTMGGTW